MSRIVTITLEEYEVIGLEAEYKRRGLGVALAGSVPTLSDSLIRKATEAARCTQPAEGSKTLHRFGPDRVFDKALDARPASEAAP